MKIICLVTILVGFWFYSFGQSTNETVKISDDLYYSGIMDSTYIIVHHFLAQPAPSVFLIKVSG